ncbi:MAG: V-type ATP synthase subunit D [Brevinemataceae bacterium]
MAKTNVTPTKSNLSMLKDELKLAKDGHGLMEQKREILIMNLSSLAAEIREKRQSLDKKLSVIFNQLAIVRLETDSLTLDLITNSVNRDYEVTVIPYSIMGVVASKLLFTRSQDNKSSLPTMGISSTGPAFDKLLHLTHGIKELLAEVAYLETVAWRLALEISKIQQRINALENFIIPDTQETIKFIKDILEEKDRETLFQIKRIKEKSRKQNLQKESADGI